MKGVPKLVRRKILPANSAERLRQRRCLSTNRFFEVRRTVLSLFVPIAFVTAGYAYGIEEDFILCFFIVLNSYSLFRVVLHICDLSRDHPDLVKLAWGFPILFCTCSIYAACAQFMGLVDLYYLIFCFPYYESVSCTYPASPFHLVSFMVASMCLHFVMEKCSIPKCLKFVFKRLSGSKTEESFQNSVSAV